MKIVFVLTYSPDPRLIKRIRTFLKYGFEVELIFAERTHPLSPYVARSVPRIYRLNYRNSDNLATRLYDLVGFVTKANSIIRAAGPDLIYTSGFDGLMAASLCGWHKRAFLIYEVSDMPGGRWYENKLYRRLINSLEKVLIRGVDKIVLTSPHFNQEGKYDTHKSEITVLENLPEKRLFATFKTKRHKDFTVGYFGLVRDKKAMVTLIKALGGLEGVRVLIAGRGLGPAYEEIVALGARFHNVELKGPFDYENDIVDLYSSVDSVYSVYDCDNENVNLALGNKLYEAIACKLPVLVTKGSKMGDFVESNGIGCAVRVDDPDDVKRAVLRMAKNESVVKEMQHRCGALRDDYFYEAAEEKFMSGINVSPGGV
ncbi:MAG: glycosyltransferase [Phycisphaerae bacterium]|nr:glycosyltransferase [Phycisphaerae bacterium]